MAALHHQFMSHNSSISIHFISQAPSSTRFRFPGQRMMFLFPVRATEELTLAAKCHHDTEQPCSKTNYRKPLKHNVLAQAITTLYLWEEHQHCTYRVLKSCCLCFWRFLMVKFNLEVIVCEHLACWNEFCKHWMHGHWVFLPSNKIHTKTVTKSLSLTVKSRTMIKYVKGARVTQIMLLIWETSSFSYPKSPYYNSKKLT